MELLVRVRWRHVPPADLQIDVEPHHTVRDLISAASNYCDGKWDESQPVFLERNATSLSLDVPIVESGIVSGDTLRFELYGIDFVDRESMSEAVSCDVTAGPEAGRSFVLLPGRHEVGRRVDFAVVLEDVTVSEHQLSVIVYDDLVTRLVPDPNAINPLVVNGRTITDSVVVGANDVVQFGATAVSFRLFSRSSDSERDQLGQVPFRRTPAKPVVVTKREFKAIGGAPVKPDKRKFPVMMVMAPAVMGLGMFAVTQQPTMLMMMAMSPMMAAFNYMESRKTGVEKYSTSVQRFGEKLEKRKADVEQALLDERAERINQSPDLADLARRATLRTLDLWPRQRSDDAFLRTRLGIGTVASKVTVEPENSGDDHIRDAVAMTLAGHDKLMACPIAVNLKELGVFGLHGPEGDVRAMCSSVILQAVTLHSPEDLVLVLIEGTTHGLGAWAKWLPHTRSATSPLSGKHIVESEAAAAEMMRELVSVARLRTADDNDRSDHRWPWIIVVIDESANVDPAIASQLLELCPAAGISVIAAVESDARIPRQAKATLDCRPPHGGALSSVWFTDAETPSEQFEPEPANARLIDQVAMSLAPLRDATAASATTAIPRVVPLLSLFGAELPTPLSVAAEWSHDKPYGLRAPIGVGPAGPLELDLVEHGPHALIGGTSGAGKSELLQSIVASLIHQYPPTRLTFLFVDYKGGASSTVFNDVPHTVGYVTNLEASLSLRALTSLRAELNFRMRLMEGKAKDLPEMLERYPDEAPPSLVIVVDEFATLVKEVPDFVAGVVDIAQRGRSLGVHLILATQRPSGSVNDNILANTNLRISLRMLDGQESQTIIGVKSAADIPLPLKGRGFAKLGPRDLIEFQSAYTGAPLAEESDVTPVIVNRFGSIARLGASSTTGWRQTSGGSRVGTGSSGGRFTPVPELQTPPGVAPLVSYEPLVDATGALAPPMSAPMQPPEPPLSPPAARERVPTIIAFPDKKPTTSGDGSGGPRPEHKQSQTHLDVLLNAVRNAMPNLPAARKPWREMLPEELPLSRIERPEQTRAAGRAGRYITIGMLDDPAAQAQYPAVFDLEEGGGLLVAGGGGSGKTTALRTAALAAVADGSPDDVCLFVIDCASRSLVALRELPHCAAVATGDDLESITRVIATLARELDRRRAQLSDLSVQAETLSAYLDKGFSMPRIVLLIDGFQNVASIVGQVQTMVYGPLDWLAELYRVITDGRQVGIHVVMATDRRQGVPALILSAIASRLVLRQTEENAYSDYGVPMAVYRGLDLPSGRGLWNNQLVQVGLVSDDPAAAAQGAAISAAATAMAASTDRRPPTQLVTVPAPDEVRVPLKASNPTRATLGRSDVFDEVVEVDIEHAGLFVFGPPRSGRTTALRQVARSLLVAGYEVWSVGIGDVGGAGRHTTGRGDAVAELINEFAALCESLPKPKPYVLVIDNVDRYGDSAITSAYDRIVKAEASRTIAATESRFQSGYTQNSMLAEVRLEPTVLVLQPDNAADVLSSTGVRPQLRPGYKMRPGRGVFIANRQPTVVQVAVGPED